MAVVDVRIFDYVTPEQLERIKSTRFTYNKTPEEAILDLINAGHDPKLIKRYLDSLAGNLDMDDVAGPRIAR
jgi:hypothetical protein